MIEDTVEVNGVHVSLRAEIEAARPVIMQATAESMETAALLIGDEKVALINRFCFEHTGVTPDQYPANLRGLGTFMEESAPEDLEAHLFDHHMAEDFILALRELCGVLGEARHQLNP